MELLVRRFADARARRVGLADQRLEAFSGERRQRIERDLLERALHVGQLRLQAGQRLAEQTQRLEEPHDIRADPAGRTEVHDLHRYAPADPIEPADPLFHDRWFPGQVEQHEAAAELEVAPLASAFRGHQQAWTIGLPEPGDLRVAARRGQLLVEDAARELRPVAERRAQHLQRLAVRHEDERLLPRVAPAGRLRQQPVRGAGRRRPSLRPAARSARSSGPSTAPSAAPDASARRTRSIFCRRATASGAAAPRTAASTASRSCQPAGSSSAIGMPTRGGKPPMSARRVELVHGGRGVARASRASKLTSSGNSSGRSSCSRRKNPWASSSSGVALRSRT